MSIPCQCRLNVLVSFSHVQSCTDVDPKLRYYALEATYNVAKSTRPAFLVAFPDVFMILFKIAGDESTEVTNAADFVADYLQQLIAEESSSASKKKEGNNDHIETLVERISSCMNVVQSSKRSFLLNWINFLDGLSMAERSLHKALPALVPGMLECLADETLEVRTLAAKLLEHFERDIASDPGRTDVAHLAVLICETLESSLSRATSQVSRGGSKSSIEAIGENDSEIKLQSIAVQWLETLVSVASNEIASCFGVILKTTLECLDRTDRELQGRAISLSDDLLSKTVNLSDSELNIFDLIKSSFDSISNLKHEVAQLESLRWIQRLLPRFPNILQANEDFDPIQSEILKSSLLQNLCILLSANSQRVSLKATAALAILSEISVASVGEDQVDDSVSNATAEEQESCRVLQAILGCFRGIAGGQLLQKRGGIILETLCVELGSEKALVNLCLLLDKEPDQSFGRMMAASLSLVLLTSSRLQGARNQLIRVKEDTETERFFMNLYKGFRRSILAVLTLAFLSKAYELAADLVLSLASYPLLNSLSSTVVELNQVVSLLEAPNFAPVRLSLLEPTKHPSLIITLRRMLMLLPQGEAFAILHRRLDAARLDATNYFENIKLEDLGIQKALKPSVQTDVSTKNLGSKLKEHQKLVEDFIEAHTVEDGP